MKDLIQLKRQIAKEAILSVAKHFNTTEYKVSIAIAKGNKKIIQIVDAVCEGTLNNLFALKAKEA